MHKRITFKGTQSSFATEAEVSSRLTKIEEFLIKEDRTPIYIDVILEPSHVHAHHKVEIRVKSPNYDRYSNYEGKDFYATLDRVVDVMYRELLEDKKKLDDKKKSQGRHEEFKKER